MLSRTGGRGGESARSRLTPGRGDRQPKESARVKRRRAAPGRTDEMLFSRFYTATAIVGPGQPAKTTIGEKRLLHTDAVDPDKLLWYRAPTRPFQAGLGCRT